MDKHNNFSMHGGHNDSIGCNVAECKYNDREDNYCTLQKIQVTKHESVAKTVECTDCGSFEKLS